MRPVFDFKIFVVDEDLFSLALYDQQLRNIGCTHVRLFENIASCVELLREEPPVIILDYRLNPAKGYRILATLKQLVPGARILFVTGPSGIIESLFSLTQGAFDYVIRHDNRFISDVERSLLRMQQCDSLWAKMSQDRGNSTN